MKARRVIKSLVLVAAVFVSSFTAAAQDGFSESVPYRPRVFENKKQPGSFTVPGPLVIEDRPITIPVSVLDAGGRVVTDLKKEDFKVLIDGPEARIVSVETRQEPLNVVIVIDVSASGELEQDTVRRITSAIVDQFGEKDRLMVAKFSDRLTILAEPTSDRDRVRTALRKLDRNNGTALYDAVGDLYEKHLASLTGRTVVILITDGVDTGSRRSYSESLFIAEKTNATVYPIYLDTYESAVSGRSSRPTRLVGWESAVRAGVSGAIASELVVPDKIKLRIRDLYDIGKLYLNDLVFLSGGRAIPAKDTTSQTLSIADELRKQYYVSFIPNSKSLTGQRRHLKVRVARPNVAVLARGSYIVGSPPSNVSPN